MPNLSPTFAAALGLMAFAGSLFADGAPNQFTLHSRHLHITYSTSGFDGQPHFTYQSGNKTLSFRGKEIRTFDSDLGTLVSVTTHMTVDAGSTTFTLVVPKMELGKNLSLPIFTQGITTAHRFSVLRQANVGQLEHSSSTVLAGTASQVVF